jgi:hypothetical protein
MRRLLSIVPLAVLVLFSAATLRAQTGCVDSPEDPTIALGMVAAITAFAFTRFRTRNNSEVKRPREMIRLTRTVNDGGHRWSYI